MDIEQFGLFIAKRRKEIGMTQQELADCVGVTNKAVSKWERGQSIPDISLFKSIASNLDVDILDLLSAGDLMDIDQIEKKEVESLMERALISIRNFNYKKIINFTYMIVMIACVIGLFVTSGVDYLFNNNITWSFITTTSILGAMFLLTVMKFNYANMVRLLFTTLFASLAISLPIVYSVLYYLNDTTWFFNEFVYYISSSLVGVIIAYIYFHFSKHHTWIKIHVSVIILDIISVLVQFLIIDNKVMLIPNFAGLLVLLLTLPVTISYTKKEDL